MRELKYYKKKAYSIHQSIQNKFSLCYSIMVLFTKMELLLCLQARRFQTGLVMRLNCSVNNKVELAEE